MVLVGLVGDDRQQPGSLTAAGRIELGPLTPGGAQGFLGDVLAVVRAAQAAGQPVHRVPVRTYPVAEVGEWGTRHRFRGRDVLDDDRSLRRHHATIYPARVIAVGSTHDVPVIRRIV